MDLLSPLAPIGALALAAAAAGSGALFLLLRTRWALLFTLGLALAAVAPWLGGVPAGGAAVGASLCLLLGLRLVVPHAARRGAIAHARQLTSPMEGAPRDEALLVKTYTSLTNRFIALTVPLTGPAPIVRLLHTWLVEWGCGEDFEARRDGSLYLRDGARILEKGGTAQILRAFFDLNLRLEALHAAVSTRDHAKELFTGVFGTAAGSSGEVLYAHGAPTLLFQGVVEPLLQACRRRGPLREALQKAEPALDITPEGRVGLGRFYEKLAALPVGQRAQATAASLAQVLRVLLPRAAEEMGQEKANAILSRSAAELLQAHGPFLAPYHPEEILPGGVSLPHLYRMHPGGSYLVPTPRGAPGHDIFDEAVHMGVPGLCITRALRRKTEGSRYIWLGRRSPDGSPATEKMAELIKYSEDFLKENPGGLVLLDGLEYLATRQDFSTGVKFRYDLKEVVALHPGRLLVPGSP
ncbi:MAG: DUF835 domain-containing protein, partial [Euryarchaeota archaeon]|nr:DUF835 domain-containing protein [Euryarchaeota archaeon]